MMMLQTVSTCTYSPVRPEKDIIRREWALLTVAGAAAAFAIVPALWPLIAQAAKDQHRPTMELLFLQLAQSIAQLSIIIATGLIFARRAGLGAPILEAWLEGKAVDACLRSGLEAAVSFGIAGAGIVIATHELIFVPLMPGFAPVIPHLLGWQGMLASFYGGVVDELIQRFLVLSGLAWIVGRFSRDPQGRPSGIAMWAVTITVAVLFALAPLARASFGAPVAPLVFARAIALNGLLGTVFGYFYWKHGLEAAVLCHLSSIVTLQLIGPEALV